MDRVAALSACAWGEPLADLEAALVALNDANAQIRRLEERCRRLVNAASDAFFTIDHAGTILDWNPQAERTFGWSRAEVLGKTVDDTIVPPSTRGPKLSELARRSADAGETVGSRYELSLLRRHRHEFPAEVVIHPATDDDDGPVVYAFVHDLTQRRRNEEERRRLALIVESSEEAIIGAGMDGRITAWSKGAQRVYGYTLEEVEGEPISVLVPPDDYEELALAADQARQGRPVHQHETKGLRRNGLLIDVALTISLICDEAGVPNGLSIVARDITEQRWMAATLNSTLQSLERALGEARESEARYRRFTADAAHQLRTPIAGIRACAETLLRGARPDEQEALLADVVRETGRATRLMTSLLQMSRLDQGRTLAPVPCDVVRLASEELDRARSLSPHLDLRLRVVDVPPHMPEVDTHAVKEILANLLDNARRHAGRSASLEIRTCADMVELRVRNDGPPVTKGMEERIFDRFVSLDGKGGSGLGLPIGRALAQAHGGDLVYRDGAFVLTLPIKAQIHCGGAGDPDFGVFEEPTEWEARGVP